MKNVKLPLSLILLIPACVAVVEAQQAGPRRAAAPARGAGAKPERVRAVPDCARRRDAGPAPDEDNEYLRSMPRLTRAAAAGDAEQVRGLLEGGAAVHEKDPFGFTPLMVAAAAGHLDVVKLLLGAGADPNAAGGIAHVGSWSVLTLAMNRCNGKWAEVVEALIGAGAEVNARAGPLPLSYAIGRRDPVLIQALLERGADVNLYGGAPLEAAVAVAEPDVEIVKVLLAAGADPNLPRLNVGGEEMSLLAYLEQYIEGSRDGGRDETDEARGEIVRLLKRAGARR